MAYEGSAFTWTESGAPKEGILVRFGDGLNWTKALIRKPDGTYVVIDLITPAEGFTTAKLSGG